MSISINRPLRRALNPLWLSKNLHRLPEIISNYLKQQAKANIPPTVNQIITATTIVNLPNTKRPQIPGIELGGFMSFPNLKILTIGEVPDLSIYCHHLRFEDDEWKVFKKQTHHNLGIDVVLIDPDTKLSQQDTMIVAELENQGTKTFMYKIDTSFAVDLQKFNPIDISNDQCLADVGTIQKLSNPNTKQEILKYSTIICSSSEFNDEQTHAQTVLNILSCGVLVATDKTPTLIKLLPDDFEFVENPLEYSLKQMSQMEYKRLSVFLRRHVHRNYSPSKIVFEIANILNLPEAKSNHNQKISILLPTKRPLQIDMALKNVASQNYKNKELILILHGDGFDVEDIKEKCAQFDFETKIIRCPTDSLFGDNLNQGVDLSSGFYLSKMDDDDWYGPNHLDDLMAAFEYSRATIVGKWANYIHIATKDIVIKNMYDKQETYVGHLPGGTFLINTELIKKVRFGHIKNQIDTELIQRLKQRGGIVYSTHSFNYIRVRHTEGHTYERDDTEYLKSSESKWFKGLVKQDYFI